MKSSSCFKYSFSQTFFFDMLVFISVKTPSKVLNYPNLIVACEFEHVVVDMFNLTPGRCIESRQVIITTKAFFPNIKFEVCKCFFLLHQVWVACSFAILKAWAYAENISRSIANAKFNWFIDSLHFFVFLRTIHSFIKILRASI